MASEKEQNLVFSLINKTIENTKIPVSYIQLFDNYTSNLNGNALNSFLDTSIKDNLFDRSIDNCLGD